MLQQQQKWVLEKSTFENTVWVPRALMVSLPSSKAHVDIRRIQHLLNQILEHSFPHIKDFVKYATLKEIFELIYKLLRIV